MLLISSGARFCCSRLAPAQQQHHRRSQQPLAMNEAAAATGCSPLRPLILSLMAAAALHLLHFYYRPRFLILLRPLLSWPPLARLLALVRAQRASRRGRRRRCRKVQLPVQVESASGSFGGRKLNNPPPLHSPVSEPLIAQCPRDAQKQLFCLPLSLWAGSARFCAPHDARARAG